MKIQTLILLSTAFTLSLAYDREALAGWFMGIKPDKVVYAVNCGSVDPFTDMTGIEYHAVI